jgi:hypothetical protein
MNINIQSAGNSNLRLVNQVKFDYINQLITISVIPLSATHCINKDTSVNLMSHTILTSSHLLQVISLL